MNRPANRTAARGTPALTVIVKPMPQANADEVCRIIRASIQASSNQQQEEAK